MAAGRQALEGRHFEMAIASLKAATQARPSDAEPRFLLGKAYFDQGKWALAVVELERALDFGYARAEVLPMVVTALAQSGQAAQATSRYGNAELPGNAGASSQLAVALAMAWEVQGEVDQVDAAVKRAIDADPTNTQAQVIAARLDAAKRNFDAAWTRIEAVLARVPADARALQTKGWLLRRWKSDIPGAIEVQRLALRADPYLVAAHSELLSMLFDAKDVQGMRDAVVMMATLLPGDIHTTYFVAQYEYLGGNLVRARQLMQTILKVFPEDARFLSFSALVDARMGSLLEAETKLSLAVRKAPDEEAPRRALAAIHLKSGKFASAMDTLRPLLAGPKPSIEVLGLAAEAALAANDFAAAEGFFERAAKGYPDDPRLLTASALRQMVFGKEAEGLAALDALSGRDRDAFADMAAIAAHLRRNDTKSALAAVERLERKSPDSPLAHITRGNIRFRSGDLAGARESYERAVALDPKTYPGISGLAAVDTAENKLPSAIGRLQDLVKAAPTAVPAALTLADLLRQAGEPVARQAAVLSKAIRANPSEVGPRVALVDLHLANKQAEEARKVADAAAEIFGGNTAVQYALGRAQIASGQPQLALDTFSKLALTPSAQTLAAMGAAQALAAQRDWAGAAQRLRQALELSPNLLEAQRMQVRLAMAEGNHSLALALARKLQSSRPKDPVGFELEGDVQLVRTDGAAAAAAYEQSLNRAAATPVAVKRHAALVQAGKRTDAEVFAESWLRKSPMDSWFMTQLGDAEAARKNWAAAERWFRAIVAIRTSDAAAQNNLAWALVNQGKPGAVEAAELANRLQPDNPTFQDTLAAALAEAGQVDRALALQKKVVAANPSAPYLRLGLARIAIKAGEKDLAQRELDTLVRQGGDVARQPEVAELQKALQ